MVSLIALEERIELGKVGCIQIPNLNPSWEVLVATIFFFLSVLNKYSPLYIKMIVVIHAICFILRKQSLPTWQEESRKITRLLVSELAQAEYGHQHLIPNEFRKITHHRSRSPKYQQLKSFHVLVLLNNTLLLTFSLSLSSWFKAYLTLQYWGRECLRARLTGAFWLSALLILVEHASFASFSRGVMLFSSP